MLPRLRFLFCIVFAAIVHLGNAQTQCYSTIEWAYTIAGVKSENTIEVELDQCGNSYTLMSTNSNSLYIDIDSTVLNVGTSTKVHLLVKHDAQGKFVWQKRLSFSASSIAVNTNGKIAITGSFSGTKDFDPGNGSYMMTATELSDIAICLLDQNGDFEWAKQIRSWRNPSYNYAGLRDSGGDIVFGNNDEILVTGRINYDSDTVDFNPNDTIDLFSVFISCNGPCSYNNRFILSLEPNGDYRWHKKYFVTNITEGRGGRLKNAGSLAIDPTTGNVINAFMGTPFQSNAWSLNTTYQIHSIDVQNGFTDWTYETEGPTTGLPVYFKDVEVDHEGNVYALFRFMWTVSPGSLENTEEYDAQYYAHGYSSGINEVEATMLVKLNGDGDYQWASPQMKQLGYGGWTEPWSSMGTQIEVFGNSLVITGQSIRDFYMKDNSNSLLATISDDTNFFEPTWDTYVAMYDLDGEPIDYKIIGGTGHQHSPIMHKDQNGFIRLLGEYSQNVVLPIDSLNSPLTQTLGYSQYSNQSASLTDMFFYNLYIDSSDAYIQNTDTFYMCFGDSVTHQGAVYYDTGSYAIDTTVSNTLYQVINSIRIEFDTALNIIGDTLYLTSGDSAFIAGNWYSQEGTYCDSTNNCDSVVCTTLMFSSSTIAECSGNTSYDEWAFVIGGVDDESVVDAALDDCGNFYVIGFTEGSTSINFDPNGSNNVSFAGGTAKRYFIVKYDATGQLAWAKNLPYQPSSIDVTPNGKIGLIGNFQGTKDFDLGSGINQLTANSGDEIFIATYDADAQLIWVKQLDGDGTDNAGDIAFGPNEEIGFTLGINEFTGSDSIDFNPDTALVDAYGYYSCGGCGNNPMKKFLVVFDSTGQWQWRHTQRAISGCGEVSSPGKCAIDEGGNVFFANVGCGEYWAQGDVHSIYKFNANGNKIWSKHLTGPGANNGDETLGLEVDENGDLYILGKFMNTVLVDSVNQISLSNDFQVGSPRCYRNVCGYRAFVAKYSSDGEYDWAHKVGYSYKNLYPVQHSLATDFSVRGGNVTISGQMLRELDFDPELLDTAVILNYDTTQWNVGSLRMEAFVASYSYEGDYKSHFLVGGPEDEGGLQIDLDDLGNVYIAGEFNDQVDLDVDSATLDLESSIGAYDLAFLKVFVDTAVFPENLDSNYVQGPDTCWNTGQKIVHGDREAGDFFGSAVAMDGDWAFTGSTDDLNGSNLNAGAVYAFRKDSNWTQTQKIVANYRSEGEYFGHLMAVDDDVLMICNDPGSGDTIKVYYFKRNTSNVWEQQQVITEGLTNKTPTSIDVENGFVYVGVSSQGKVLVYELSGNTWSLDQTITGSSGNRFGVSVAVEDDLLAVGAIWDDFDENGQNNVNKAGSAKLYTRSGQNPWSLSTKVVSPNREANGYFGWDVELMNGELYVGSYTTDYQSLNQAGAVYRLADDSGWSTIQTILPAEHFSGGIFGYAIDSDDDKLIVGHRRYSGVVSGNTLTWEGAAHLFALNDSNEMEEIEIFFSTNRNGGDEFGLDVAISDASTIIGSYFDQTDENNSNTISQAGAAHIFDGDCDPVLVVYNYDTTNLELCSGDSIYAQGAWQFNAGQFIDTISIDTILLTNVSIADAINTSETLTICNGGSVMVHGQMVSQPGTYVDTSQTSAGCDSVSTILVQEGTSSYQFELAWIYDGDSMFVGGDYQTTPDLYVDTMAIQSGCDSIVETLLWVYPVQYGTDSIAICQGDSILLGGVMRSSAGTYTDTAMIGGTAHINQVSLFINQPVVSNSTMSITTGDSIYLAGAWRYSSGTYCDTIGGCDTVSCVQLTVGNLTYMTIYDSIEICSGDSHWVGSYHANTSGYYIDTVGDGNGVDTIYQTELYVDPFNAVVEIYSTGMWLKSNQLNPPFMWFDCDSQTVVATTQQGYYQPGYSGNFSLINQASTCGDTSACVYHNNTQNKGSLEVRGYPTGARDQYTLVFETMQSDVQIDLYDLQGQLLHSWMELSIQQTTLPLSNVASGVYLVRIHATEGQATLKFAKLVD